MEKIIVLKDGLKKVFEGGDWKDISHETYRKYKFDNTDEGTITIEKPQFLHISKSGGHYILDEKSVSHYIPSGWMELTWETDDDVAFRF